MSFFQLLHETREIYQNFLAIFFSILTIFRATEKNKMAITVTVNMLLKANLCISIFDARNIIPSEKVCLFFGKSFMMVFCSVCYVMHRTARAQQFDRTRYFTFIVRIVSLFPPFDWSICGP